MLMHQSPSVTTLTMVPLPCQPNTYTYSTKHDHSSIKRKMKTILSTITWCTRLTTPHLLRVLPPLKPPPPPREPHQPAPSPCAWTKHTRSTCKSQGNQICSVSSLCPVNSNATWFVCDFPPKTPDTRDHCFAPPPPSAPTSSPMSPQNPTCLIASCGAPSFATSHSDYWCPWVADLG